ncbi:stringent starvation protein B [Corallococcus sp. H22C18031201]|uniref:ClpXP protease specificity-enhancing factor SspB n=1 Tax=Citreicoccus inhibens TaxID=2849499 RepID=UPI000E712D45|nr:ClpXP protease specificity-enhancing factor SspB [Citreicoccus inhibens]MBU8897707.1 stringent starvation protein B [Citreicoccus inhibens]RJS27477.1 stringent starvation protein B [Corallococcus sp. H22C18031201]
MDKKVLDKKERLLAALDQGMVMIRLDARRPGVLVPPSLRGEADVRLNLSYRFDPPDLAVGEWGIRSTLSFAGSRFTVAVPWSALFEISSHVTRESWLYPDDLPPELFAQPPMTAARPPMPVPVPVASERPRPFLRDVSSERTEEPPVSPVTPEGPRDEPPTPRRGHLRVVK